MDMNTSELKVKPKPSTPKKTTPKVVSWKRPLRTYKPAKVALWSPPLKITKPGRRVVEDVEDEEDGDEGRGR